VFVIGVDPHKASHTAAALETSEEVIAECRLDADGRQLGRLLEWAEPFMPRRWAVEGATGPGAPCWPVSSSPPVSRSLTCPRH
jgi:hypothetical protein